MTKHTRKAVRSLAWTTGAIALVAASTVAAKNWDDWSGPLKIETLPNSGTAVNTPSVDGCASHSPDGLTIVFNSNRDGTDQDLYIATRSSTSDGFGDPEPLPGPVNTAANEACPTIANGHRLYFSSDREDPAYDLYVSRLGKNGWSDPVNLGPNINRDGWLDESAAFFEDEQGNEVMLFSRRLPTGPGEGKIFQSVNGGPASPVPGGPAGTSAGVSDNRPSVTRDGLTIYFDSNRSGGLGGPDLYYATRSRTSDQFETAIHLRHLSSTGFDGRPYISKDGAFLTYSSGRSGSESILPDIWYSVREKRTGK